MNESIVRAALVDIERVLGVIHAELAPVPVVGDAPTASAVKGEPLGIDNVAIREWSDEVARMTQRQCNRMINEGNVRAVGPWDALAMWANRPETSVADMETIRRSRRRLAEMFAPDEAYGVAIPRVLAVNAGLPGDPNAPGFVSK